MFQIIVDTRRLAGYSQGLNDRLRNVVSIAAHNIEGKGKDKVPVDTGATKNSIVPTFEDQGFAARIGPSTFYAPFLEFGTRRMAARPFMIPALESERGPFVRAIEKALEL